jgi:hypothetical protein
VLKAREDGLRLADSAAGDMRWRPPPAQPYGGGVAPPVGPGEEHIWGLAPGPMGMVPQVPVPATEAVEAVWKR